MTIWSNWHSEGEHINGNKEIIAGLAFGEKKKDKNKSSGCNQIEWQV